MKYDISLMVLFSDIMNCLPPLIITVLSTLRTVDNFVAM